MAKKVQQDSGLQPFNRAKKESVVEFLQRTTWFQAMTTALQRHSEFMQPWDNEYPEMEYGYPNFSGVPRLPLGENNVTVDLGLNCPGCSFGAMKFIGPNGDEDAQICFPYSGKICMTPEFDALYQEWKKTKITPPMYGGGHSFPTAWSSAAAWAGGTFTFVQTKGTHADIIWVPDALRYYRGGYCIWPVGGKWPTDSDITVRIMFTDFYGNKCADTEYIRAACCDGATPMTFDDANTADTIAPGGSGITVFVLNGCGPFTWSVVGQGYSFAAGQTTGRSNTLSLASGSCGSGDDEAGPYGAVTITDFCGVSAQATIKSTAGKWGTFCTLQTSVPVSTCTGGCYTVGATQLLYYSVTDIKRWQLNLASGPGNWCVHTSDAVTWIDYIGDCGSQTPSCGTPKACSPAHGGSCQLDWWPYTCIGCMPLVNGTTNAAATLQIWGC